MIAHFAALTLIGAALQPDGDRPVVILFNTGDTGWVHPLDTAKRAGDLWRGELIAIQSLSEHFTIVRTDAGVEIDCIQSRARILGGRSYGHNGPLPAQEPDQGPQPWETIDADAWPAFQMLHAIACQPIDLAGHSQPLKEAEERIRSRISDF